MPAQRSGTLHAFLVSALALPGMVGVAQASSDDVVSTTTAKVPSLPAWEDTAQPDQDQQFGFQYSHYQEGQRNLIGPVTKGVIPGAPGSPVTGTIYGVGAMPSMPAIKADGEHAFARFRLGDRTRLGIDFVEDIWSGASPMATLPASMVSGATMASGAGGLFNAQGKPFQQTQYQANANPSLPNNPPQKNVYTLDTQIGHAMGYASAEARKQTTLKYGFDWDEQSLDLGAGVSREVDFLSQFGNVAWRRDFNDKRTSVNLGLSYTHGETHAEQDTDAYNRMLTDAYPAGQFTQHNLAGHLVATSAGINAPILAPLITGRRQDVALTGGLTQVVNRNDLFSTGVGYTNTTGFLSNPYKGSYVFTCSPAGEVAYPDLLSCAGRLEMERRPSLRNQFTWDTSYLHYVDRLNAAVQAHYGLFVDNWGIVAHTFDAEWRQSLGSSWVVTPRLRYYTQRAANFYAPYFFMSSTADLPNHSFSSDERLSAYGTLNPGVSISKTLSRGLKVEAGAEYSKRSGSFKLGTGGDGAYADLHSSTVYLALTGSLGGNAVMDADGSPEHAHHMAHHHEAAVPAGVMGAQMMDDPGSLMLGYTFEQDRQGGTLLQGSSSIPAGTGMLVTGMTMQMQMLELMYAQNRWINWMVMPQLVDMNMGMFMNEHVAAMSMNNMRMHSFMTSGGWGDTDVSALIRLWDAAGQHVHLTQGISLPTGSVNIRTGGGGNALPFNMQTGSGTWDYTPGLSYTGMAQALNWGGQASAIKRLQSRNSSGYSLGDEARLSAWAGYSLFSLVNLSLRGQYVTQGSIRGSFINAVPPVGTHVPTAGLPTDSLDPASSGGRFADVGLGLSAALGKGAYAGDRVSFEYLKPVYTHVYGTQNNRIGAVVLNAKFMF